MKNKKKFSAAVAATIFALSMCSVSAKAIVSAAESLSNQNTYDEPNAVALDFSWVPDNFDEALSFTNMYGRTHTDGKNLVCCVRAVPNYDEYVHSVEVDNEDYDKGYISKEYYKNEDDTLQFKSDTMYEVTVFYMDKNDKLSFSCRTERYINDMTFSYDDCSFSFESDENGNITQTDIFGWLPDSIGEYREYRKANDVVSLHENYVVFAECVCTDGGYELITSQSGEGELREFKKFAIFEATAEPIDPGNSGNTVAVYEPVKEGNVKAEFKIARPWETDKEPIALISKNYKIDSNLSIHEITSNNNYTEGYSYTVENGSIIFDQSSSNAQISYIISSNSDYDMTCGERTSVFTPEKDGTYVLTVEELCEAIISVGMSNSGHFHYFYPVLTYYTAHVQNGEITVQKNYKHSWYSEEQIEKIVAECASTELIVCSDVMAEGSENLLNGEYFSYVNGEMPLQDSHLKNYITNYYNKYNTESYFCMNVGYLNETDMIMPRIVLSDYNLAECLSEMHTSGSATSDDIMDFYMVRAKKDGKLSITADGFMEFDLEIKNGIFKRADKIKEGVPGDVNGDGILSVSDSVMLQKYLLVAGKLTNRENADICKDGRINVFDLCQMKAEMMEK